MSLSGHHFHRQILGQVLGDPVQQAAQSATFKKLHGELPTELRLAARPLQEHDQEPRDRERHLASRSASTMSSAKSIPAVAPAEV